MNRRSIFKRLLGAVGLAAAPAALTAAPPAANPLFSGAPAQWDYMRYCMVKDTTGRFQMYSMAPNSNGGLVLYELSPSQSLPISQS